MLEFKGKVLFNMFYPGKYWLNSMGIARHFNFVIRNKK